MDALVMCGGRGTRLDAPGEKPLFELAGTPMVDRVLNALCDSRVDDVHAVVSPHGLETRRHVLDRGVNVVETPGDGYAADLAAAADRVGQPVLTVNADLPLLAPECVHATLDAYDGDTVTVCIPTAVKRLLGLGDDASFDATDRRLSPTGVRVLDEPDRDWRREIISSFSPETRVETHDVRLAVNVNRHSDARVAAELLGDAERNR
jgi:adenosylcobinamide-phosphate guanylyltransferase